MIDTLEAYRSKAENLDLNNILRENSENRTWKDLKLTASQELAIITIHRPSNVDSESTLSLINGMAEAVSSMYSKLRH